MRRAVISSLVFVLFVSQAAAYTRLAVGSGTDPIYEWWPGLPLTYVINDQTSDELPNVAAGSDPVEAVRRAFQTWEDVPGAAVRFNYAGTVANTAAANDGVNLISFVDTSFPYNGALAVNSRFRYTTTGLIVDSDIVFNPSVQWSTRGSAAGVHDIQQTTTHEGGHSIGLGHSPLLSATMYPYGSDDSHIERRLDSDDIAAVVEAFPAATTGSRFGSIEGRVTRAGSAVFGAHVVALDDAGRPVASALSFRDGDYRISGLPAGIYQVYVEPLDGPMTQVNLAAYWGSAPFDSAFGSALASEEVEVVAAAATSGVNLAVGDFAPGLNPGMIGLQPATGGSFSVAPRLAAVLQGQVNTWNIALVGQGLSSPTTFSVTGAGVTRVGGFGYMDLGGGDWLVIAAFNVESGAEASPRTVRIERAGEVAWFSGALEVLPSPARLTVSQDPLHPGAVYLSWYGGHLLYDQRRDTVPDFAAPLSLYQEVDLQHSDPVLDDGIDYFYRAQD